MIFIAMERQVLTNVRFIVTIIKFHHYESSITMEFECHNREALVYGNIYTNRWTCVSKCPIYYDSYKLSLV